MRTVFRKGVLVIMAAMVAMSFAACLRELNRHNVQEVSRLLNQKYGIEFEVKSIRNRSVFNQPCALTAYCYPKDNKTVVFSAVMDVDRTLVSDDYPLRLLETEAGRIIEGKFRETGIDAAVAVSIARLPQNDSLLDYDFEDLITEFSDLSFTFTTVVCEGANARNTYDTVVALLERFYSGNPEMLLGTTVWKYSAEGYAACSKEMSSIPYVSKTVLEQHGPLSKVNVAMVDGVLNTRYDQFREKF